MKNSEKKIHFKNLESKTKEVYELSACAFDQQRSKSLFEKKWLDIFLSHLKEGDSVLDVGCGSGDPIAKYLIEEKMKVTGIDYSHAMIDMAKNRFPHSQWYVQDMRELELSHEFRGIIAWNSYFHLNQTDQKKCLSLFSQYLEKGGVFMTTVGPEKGEVEGLVNNQKVYHSSLSPDEYKESLEKHGFKLQHFVLNDPECNEHTVLVACRC